MDTETEIKQREEQRTNDTPAVEDTDTDDGTEDSGMLAELPVPSISQKQLLIIGVVVAVAVALLVMKRKSGGSGDTLEDVRQQDFEPNVAVEEEPGIGQIEVPVSNVDPLAGDEAVTKAFRESGRLAGEQ